MKVKTNYANAPVWREINVKSRIPESLKMLEEMARNIWWAWNDEATEMFKELDPEPSMTFPFMRSAYFIEL